MTRGSALPVWHGRRTLADLRDDAPDYAHCARPLALARQWVDRVGTRQPPTKGLFLTGSVGAGKTSIAAAVAVETGCAFWDARCLFAAMKEEMNLPSVRDPVLERCVRAPVLVFDDFGEWRSTAWVVETVRDLVKRRYDRGGLNVFTSNLSGDEVSRLLGPAAWSRFKSSMVVVQMDGPDLRMVAA